MKKVTYPDPAVKVIISTARRPASKKKGKATPQYYGKKKKSGVNQKRAYLVIGAVIAIIIIAMLLTFAFPTWKPITGETEENIAPLPYIEVQNGVQKSKDLVSVEVNMPVIFSAINSTDKDGSINKYNWDFGDGDSATGVKVQHTYDDADTYMVTLEIIDDQQESATKKIAVRVNAPPVAIIDLQASVAFVNTPVFVSGTNSYDPDWTGNEPIAQYLWDFGDGPKSSEKNTTHIYKNEGNFTISLTVWDNHDASDSVTGKLQITLRSYEVVWTLHNETGFNRFGFTRENQTTELNTNITEDDLYKVVVRLNWTDFMPILNLTESDEFELLVTTPSGDWKVVNSTSELIIIEFTNINVRENYNITAESLVAATELVNVRSPTSDSEVGQWDFDITALRCSGGYVRDFGNSWRLVVEYYYYTVDIIET
jgi:PKD repeat protein